MVHSRSTATKGHHPRSQPVSAFVCGQEYAGSDGKSQSNLIMETQKEHQDSLGLRKRLPHGSTSPRMGDSRKKMLCNFAVSRVETAPRSCKRTTGRDALAGAERQTISANYRSAQNGPFCSLFVTTVHFGDSLSLDSGQMGRHCSRTVAG